MPHTQDTAWRAPDLVLCVRDMALYTPDIVLRMRGMAPHTLGIVPCVWEIVPCAPDLAERARETLVRRLRRGLNMAD